MLYLLATSHSRMIFEHLWDYFQHEDLTSGFPQLFQLYFHIAQGHIPLQIAHVIGTTHLLTMIQTFRWSSSHYSGGNIVSTHKPHFMPSIAQNFCNTFFPTTISSYN